MVYKNTDYWNQIHKQYEGMLRAVGWPGLSETFNELKYKSEADSILSVFSEICSTLAESKKEPISILEIGVGIGYWTSLLSSYLSVNHIKADLTCLDISQEALDLVKLAHPEVETIQADLKTVVIDQCAESFDIVHALAVLHHLVNLDDFLNGLRFATRSVKSGGYFVIYDPILTMHYSKFDVIDFPSYTGNGMPRRLSLIDDILQSEGFERINIRPGTSFLLNSSIQGHSWFGYTTTTFIWGIFRRFIYRSD